MTMPNSPANSSVDGHDIVRMVCDEAGCARMRGEPFRARDSEVASANARDLWRQCNPKSPATYHRGIVSRLVHVSAFGDCPLTSSKTVAPEQKSS